MAAELKQYDFLFKLLLTGDSGVGKTCILDRYCDAVFNSTFISTIGIDLKIRTVDIDGKKIKLRIWDTAGQERFRKITIPYYQGAMGIMLVYDVTNEKSFDNIRNWIREIEEHGDAEVEIMLLGNKCDCDHQRIVSTEIGQLLADEHGFKFMEISAKSGHNIQLAFMNLVRGIKSKVDKENESECLEVFKRGDKQNAMRLLRLHIRPAKARTEHLYTVMVDGIKFTIASESSLLHLAATHGWMDVISDLITKYKCVANCENIFKDTPLHYASSAGHLEVVRYFINEQHCDPMTKDKYKGTPLHYACRLGHPHIVQYLLSIGKVDPLAKDHKGKTPVDLAIRHKNCYDLLKLFRSFPQCKRDFPVHTYTKLVLTGYSGAGKTTTSQLILLLAKQAGLFSVLSSGRVTDVECLTAGIIPLHVESKVKDVGNMVIYDFAGQREYYSSHAAVLERIMRNSAAIFVCIVDLSQCMEKISESIQYWMSFIENACSSAQESSRIIIVGSHADQFKSLLELKEKSSLVERIAESRVKQLTYGGFVSMDCRESKSKEARHFRSLLSTSQQAILSSQPSMGFYCHVLYAFLCTKLGKTSCKLQELSSAFAAETDFSFDSTVLTESLTSLSDKGLILFVQNQKHPQSSWVVVEKDALLREVNGTLFAPGNFKQYRQVASNTGIVPIATLEDLFPQHSSEMLVGCLESMEFCHPVDPSALKGTNLEPSNKTTSSSPPSGASHLFFPSLVKEHRPDDLPSPRFGWCLGCSDPHQFFSNRFLHVLLLRLAFTFPLASDYLPPSSSLCGLERQCKVWQYGIIWKSVSGVSTIVEIVDRNRWVIVLVSEKSREAAETCSSVIRMILDLQQQLCSAVSTCECLISPSLLDRYPFDALPDTDLFVMRNVAKSMLLHHKVLLDRKEGMNTYSTDEALSCEPYYLLQPSSVCHLFKQSIASQPVPDPLLQEVLRYCQQPQQKPQDHKELRECVNKHSVFAGRNPLEVAELKEEDIISHTATATQLPTAAATTELAITDTDVSSDMSRTLSTGDLVDVLEFVQNVSDWKRLGLTLGLLLKPTLTDIETYRRGKPDDCKIDMLSAWLEQQDNVSQRGVPSWSVLRAALIRIGENEIANRIANTTES